MNGSGGLLGSTGKSYELRGLDGSLGDHVVREKRCASMPCAVGRCFCCEEKG